MDNVENKLIQIEELKAANANFVKAINGCKAACESALNVFEGVQDKTLAAISKQYKKRVVAALKALNGEQHKKAVQD